jgi:hypothetical protein
VLVQQQVPEIAQVSTSKHLSHHSNLQHCGLGLDSLLAVCMMHLLLTGSAGHAAQQA